MELPQNISGTEMRSLVSSLVFQDLHVFQLSDKKDLRRSLAHCW